MQRAVCGGGLLGGGLAREVRSRRMPQGLIWTIYCSLSAAMWLCKRTLHKLWVLREKEGSVSAAAIQHVFENGKVFWKRKLLYSHHVGTLDISSIWEASSYSPTLPLSLRGEPSHTVALLLTPEASPHKSAGLPPHCHWYAVITSSQQPGLCWPLLPLSR